MSEEQQDDQQQDNNQAEDELAPDDTYRDTPVFDVSQKDFFANMRQSRNRMRFSNSSKPSKYMQQTKYRRPFYMRYTDPRNGENYMKKVK